MKESTRSKERLASQRPFPFPPSSRETKVERKIQPIPLLSTRWTIPPPPRNRTARGQWFLVAETTCNPETRGHLYPGRKHVNKAWRKGMREKGRFMADDWNTGGRGRRWGEREEEKENLESSGLEKGEKSRRARSWGKISTRFSPARNHLECSRATSSRRIKVLFWGRETGKEGTVWTLSVGEMASLSANFSVNRDRRNFLYPAPSPFHHRSLQWNQVAAAVVERNRFRGNERRGSMMKYSAYCATLLAIFSPIWYDRTSCLWECIHTSKKFCRYFGYRDWY